MIFAGLDVSFDDVVVIEIMDSRTCQPFTIVGEIRGLYDTGETKYASERKHIKVQTKNRPLLVAEKRVKRIAFLDEEPPLLINIWEEEFL